MRNTCGIVCVCGLMLLTVSGCQTGSPQEFTFHPTVWATPVHQAAQYHPVEELRKQIDQHGQVNARDQMGRTPLMLAARSASSVTPNLELLIHSGADVNAADVRGMTALMYASVGMWRHAHGISRTPEDVTYRMRILIQAGADTQARTVEGLTVLMVAAAAGTYESLPNAAPCRLLVQAGADINARDVEGRTALMHAAERSGVSIPALLELGSPIDAQDKQGRTALMHSFLGVWPVGDAVEPLLKGRADLELADVNGWTALTYAAWKAPTLYPAAMLIAAGASIEPLGWTPLHAASLVRDPKVTEAQLAAGGDANGRDRFGRSPLMWASRFHHGETQVARALLAHGARTDGRDSEGLTALHIAAATGGTEELEVLFSAGADIHARDNQGRTPLMLAAAERWGRFNVERLINAGANVNAKDHDGRTALMHAIGTTNPDSLIAWDSVREIIRAGGNPNAQDASGETIVEYAARRDKGTRRELESVLAGR